MSWQTWLIGWLLLAVVVFFGTMFYASLTEPADPYDGPHNGSLATHGLDQSRLLKWNGHYDRMLCVGDQEWDGNSVKAEGYYGQGKLFRVWDRTGSGGPDVCELAPKNMHNHRVEEDTDGKPPGYWSIH